MRQRPRGRPPGGRTRHREIAKELAKNVRSHHWRPGHALPSLSALAAEFRTSIKTVRLALATVEREGLYYRTARGTWVVQEGGSATSARYSQVALVFTHGLELCVPPGPWQMLHLGILAGVASSSEPLLIVHGARKTLRREVPPDLFELSLQGVLLVGNFCAGALRGYRKFPRPVVLVDQPAGKSGLASISVDNAGAVRECVARLLALGHRRIAFLRRVHLRLGDVDPDSKERGESFKAACSAAGLAASVFNFFNNERSTQKSIQTILEAVPPYTAVLAADPSIAQDLVLAARRSGLRVPQDFGILTFAPLQPASEWSGPRIDFFEMGRRAVRLLSEFDNGPPQVRVPAAWATGRTLGPPPG